MVERLAAGAARLERARHGAENARDRCGARHARRGDRRRDAAVDLVELAALKRDERLARQRELTALLLHDYLHQRVWRDWLIAESTDAIDAVHGALDVVIVGVMPPLIAAI